MDNLHSAYNDKIDDYLMHRLTPEERTAFEEELSNNHELQEELQFQKQMFYVIRDERRKELKNYIRQNATKEDNIQRKRTWLYARIAVPLLLLIGIVWVLVDNKTVKNDVALIEKHPENIEQAIESQPIEPKLEAKEVQDKQKIPNELLKQPDNTKQAIVEPKRSVTQTQESPITEPTKIEAVKGNTENANDMAISSSSVESESPMPSSETKSVQSSNNIRFSIDSFNKKHFPSSNKNQVRIISGNDVAFPFTISSTKYITNSYEYNGKEIKLYLTKEYKTIKTYLVDGNKVVVILDSDRFFAPNITKKVEPLQVK